MCDNLDVTLLPLLLMGCVKVWEKLILMNVHGIFSAFAKSTRKLPKMKLFRQFFPTLTLKIFANLMLNPLNNSIGVFIFFLQTK